MKNTKEAAEDALQQMFGTKPKKPQWKPNKLSVKSKIKVEKALDLSLLLVCFILFLVICFVLYNIYSVFFAPPVIKMQ